MKKIIIILMLVLSFTSQATQEASELVIENNGLRFQNQLLELQLLMKEYEEKQVLVSRKFPLRPWKRETEEKALVIALKKESLDVILMRDRSSKAWHINFFITSVGHQTAIEEGINEAESLGWLFDVLTYLSYWALEDYKAYVGNHSDLYLDPQLDSRLL